MNLNRIRANITVMTKKIYEPASSVYIYIYSDGLDTQAADEIIGIKSRHIPHIKPESPLRPVEYIWCGQWRWHYGDDVHVALEDFLFKQLPEFADGFAKIQKQGARIQLDWVIGVGDAGTEGFYPILSLDPKLISELDKWKFDLKIYLDSQIDAEQVGLRP
jgi:hypothetical protein